VGIINNMAATVTQPCYGFRDFDSVAIPRGRNGLASLARTRCILPLYSTVHSADPPDVLHNSHRNVFAGVGKGSAPASFGEQEEELRDPRGARDWLIWKSHGAHPSSRMSHVDLT
jgi:hypothetical protein